MHTSDLHREWQCLYKDLKATIRLSEDYTNTFNQDDEAILTFTPGSYSSLGGKMGDKGYYAIGYENRNEFDSNFILTYTKKLIEDLNMNVYVGYNINERSSNQLANSVNSLSIPGFYNIQNSSATPTDVSYISDRRLCGLYGNIDLAFKEYWFLGLDYRRDWSSTLPTTNDHYDYYGFNTSFL